MIENRFPKMFQKLAPSHNSNETGSSGESILFQISDLQIRIGKIKLELKRCQNLRKEYEENFINLRLIRSVPMGMSGSKKLTVKHITKNYNKFIAQNTLKIPSLDQFLEDKFDLEEWLKLEIESQNISLTAISLLKSNLFDYNTKLEKLQKSYQEEVDKTNSKRSATQNNGIGGEKKIRVSERWWE